MGIALLANGEDAGESLKRIADYTLLSMLAQNEGSELPPFVATVESVTEFDATEGSDAIFADPQILGMYGPATYPVLISDLGGRLHAIASWQNQYPLTATSRDSFALPVQGMYGGEHVVFSRDSNGGVTGMHFANMYFEKLPQSRYPVYSYASIPLIRPVNALTANPLPEDAVQDTTIRNSELVDLALIDPLLNIDMPLATTNNIFGEQVYPEARALVQQPLAESLFRIQRQIRRQGYELIIFDAYRPWRTSNAIWNSVPDSLKQFFDDPAEGTCQNRGAAVSLSFFELATGQPLRMPTDYGILSSYTFAHSPLSDSQSQQHRDLLRRTMEAEGFHVSPTRWWHFIHDSCPSYPIIDKTFDQIDQESRIRQQRIFTID